MKYLHFMQVIRMNSQDQPAYSEVLDTTGSGLFPYSEFSGEMYSAIVGCGL